MKKIKLLASTILASSALVPALMVVTSCNSSDIKIVGDAKLDKTNSHIKLHEESTIVLITEGLKEINVIQAVKINGVELTNGYTYNPFTNTITIEGTKMTSMNIEVHVDVTTVTKKQKFGKMWDRYLYTYMTSTKEYTIGNFSKLWIDGQLVTITDFDYKIVEDVEGKVARLYFQFGALYNWFNLSLNFYGSWNDVANEFVDDSYGGQYTFNDNGSIEYAYTGSSNVLRKVCINKYGYIYEWTDTMGVQINITGEPQEPTGPAITGVQIASKEITVTITDSHVTSAKVLYDSISIPSNRRGDITWTWTGTGQIDLDKTTTQSEQPLKIFGRKAGTVFLTASCEGFTDTCTISVTTK